MWFSPCFWLCQQNVSRKINLKAGFIGDYWRFWCKFSPVAIDCGISWRKLPFQAFLNFFWHQQKSSVKDHGKYSFRFMKPYMSPVPSFELFDCLERHWHEFISTIIATITKQGKFQWSYLLKQMKTKAIKSFMTEVPII